MAEGVETPNLGSVELEIAPVEPQLDFYTGVMGLSAGTESPSRVRLVRATADRFLFLEPEGQSVGTRNDRGSPFEVPVWLSFETPDVAEARERLTEEGISILG